MKATKLKRIGSVLLFSLLFVGAAIFYGWPLLNMFGVVKYDPVMSQSSDQIVRVELFEGNGEEYSLRASISGDVLPLFLEDFMEIEFRRYVSHPPASQGKRVIKISYADGGYDLVGDIVDFFLAIENGGFSDRD